MPSVLAFVLAMATMLLCMCATSIPTHVRNRRFAMCRCPACDYDLRGLRSPTCPECGRFAPGATIQEVGPLAGICLVGIVSLVQVALVATILSSRRVSSPLATAALCCGAMVVCSVIVLGAAISFRRVIGPLLLCTLLVACAFDVALVSRLLGRGP